jgi:hypothetical protein
MPNNNQPVDLDDWLQEGLENAINPPPAPPPRPESRFPTVPTPVLKQSAQSPQQPAKPKSLSAMGITKGGVIRNASTVERTELKNPVTNPKNPLRGPVKTAEASFSDQNELPPEFGVPGTLMTSMDADLEKRAQERAQSVISPRPEAQPASAYEKPAPAQTITPTSTLRDLVAAAIASGGALRLATTKFVLEIQITA